MPHQAGNGVSRSTNLHRWCCSDRGQPNATSKPNTHSRHGAPAPRQAARSTLNADCGENGRVDSEHSGFLRRTTKRRTHCSRTQRNHDAYTPNPRKRSQPPRQAGRKHVGCRLRTSRSDDDPGRLEALKLVRNAGLSLDAGDSRRHDRQGCARRPGRTERKPTRTCPCCTAAINDVGEQATHGARHPTHVGMPLSTMRCENRFARCSSCVTTTSAADGSMACLSTSMTVSDVS